jgi:hypothetical protein
MIISSLPRWVQRMFNPHLFSKAGGSETKIVSGLVVTDGSFGGKYKKSASVDDNAVTYAPSAAQSGKTLTHLNRIQSAVFETAFNTNENMFKTKRKT